MKRLIIICLMLFPIISFAQWPRAAKKFMENALFKAFDQSFIIDSAGKEKMVECVLNNYEAAFPDFEKFRKTSIDSLNTFENKLRLTCINDNRSSLKIFYTRWEVLNNFTNANLKTA